MSTSKNILYLYNNSWVAEAMLQKLCKIRAAKLLLPRLKLNYILGAKTKKLDTLLCLVYQKILCYLFETARLLVQSTIYNSVQSQKKSLNRLQFVII